MKVLNRQIVFKDLLQETRDQRLHQLVNYEIEPESLSEKEIAGYRDVLALVNENFEYMPLKTSIILQLHRDLYKYEDISIGGKYKNGDNQIIETDENGIKKLRFSPLPAWETPRAMEILCENYNIALNHQEYEPLVLIPIFILDYVCIHPFNDGNGRTSRLLTSLLLYRIDCFVGKYISLEKLIEENKEGYYEALQQSSDKWREDQHTYVPFVEYFLKIILTAYRKYFSLLNEDGTLAPRFIVVANMDTSDGGAEIVAGNERVLRARLSDAKFFWDADRKETLDSKVEKLKARVIQP